MNLSDLTANDSQLGQVRLHIVAEGPATGTRVLLVQPAGGIHARLLLDRGMDIGSAWFAGQPISWLSAVGEQKPGFSDQGNGWLQGWAGGLMTTCGLHNVGQPNEGFGRHGTYTERSAENIHVTNHLKEDGTEDIEITATIHDHDGLSRGLILHRKMTFSVGLGQITVQDRVENQSTQDLQAPILYHVNFGYPFLTSESALEGEITRSVLNSRPEIVFRMDPRMGLPRAEDDEVVEHEVLAHDGIASLTLSSPALAMKARVSWRIDELPRIHTWRRSRPGSYVHAVEPANCSVNGRIFDRELGRAPILRASSARRTELAINVYNLDGV